MFEGAYLIQSDVEVFIDPRLEVHGDAAFRRYLRMQDDQQAWNDEARERGFRTALVDVQSPFVLRILAAGGWELVHFDEVAALFARAEHLGTAAPIRSPEGFAHAVERLRADLPRPAPASGSRFARAVSPIPYLRVATFLMMNGRAELAQVFAEDALAAWPRTPGAHAILAQIRSARGDHAGAIEHDEAEQAALGSPSLPLERQLAFEYFAAGRRGDALPALERLVAAVPTDHIAWAALAKLYSESGRSADALRAAERAIALAPRNPEYRKNLGRSQGLAGDRRAAAATLEKAFRLDPADITVARDLVSLYAEQGDRSRALRYLERGLALRPDDPELNRAAAKLRG
jgi:Flp pilus assembly protein TadD